MEITDSISISMRPYFSITHINSAALLTKCAFEIEKEHDGTFSQDVTSKHFAFVTGGILFSVFALEACINEFFSDSAERQSHTSNKLDSETVHIISHLWKEGVPRTATFSILKKFQIALALCKKTQFDPGSQPFQDASLLIGLRNALVHYEPEFIKFEDSDDYTERDIHKFEKQLKGKFDLNPLAGKGNPFYPYKCLGHGCAEWAVKTCAMFIREFIVKIEVGRLDPYDNLKTR